MAPELLGFRVEQLHGRYDVNVRYEHPGLILVGENGSGKTTIANILFYCLSKQWSKLLDYDFRSIELEFADYRFAFERSLLEDAMGTDQSRYWRRIPTSFRDRLQRELQAMRKEGKLSHRALRDLTERYPVPLHVLDALVTTMNDAGDLFTSVFDEANQQIDARLQCQVLYLPTYRRIEQELEKLLSRTSKAFEEISTELHTRRRHDQHIEFIEFGMKDVDEAIELTLGLIAEQTRRRLSEIVSSHFADIMNQKYLAHGGDLQQLVHEEGLSAVVKRIPDSLISKESRQRLEQDLTAIAEKGESEYNDRDHILVHFFDKVANVFRAQLKDETPLRRFVETCNSYLVGKHVHYSSDDLKVQLLLEGTDGASLLWRQLSSGEKQIVSLFCHLFLTTPDRFFLIIDEPELSLSIDWQRRFIADIMSSGRCIGLFAATHSPFIFENEYDEWARPIGECKWIRRALG